MWGRIEVDAVGFPGKVQVAPLGEGFPVVQGFDVAEPVHALHLHIAHVADGEIGVQRLAEGHRVGAQVMAGEVNVQLLVEADAQLQLDPVRPAR